MFIRLHKKVLPVGRQGQRTLEYMLILAAIIGIIIFAAASVIKPSVEVSLNNVSDAFDDIADRIDNQLP